MIGGLLAEGGKIILITLPDSLQAKIHERDLQNSGNKPPQQPAVSSLQYNLREIKA